MQAALLAAVVVSAVSAGGTMANEAMHGGLAEAMGLGHHHMADYDGAHCASHGGAHAAQHMTHMHGAHPVPHDSCPGGASMHHSGAPMGGMMHG